VNPGRAAGAALDSAGCRGKFPWRCQTELRPPGRGPSATPRPAPPSGAAMGVCTQPVTGLHVSCVPGRCRRTIDRRRVHAAGGRIAGVDRASQRCHRRSRQRVRSRSPNCRYRSYRRRCRRTRRCLVCGRQPLAGLQLSVVQATLSSHVTEACSQPEAGCSYPAYRHCYRRN